MATASEMTIFSSGAGLDSLFPTSCTGSVAAGVETFSPLLGLYTFKLYSRSSYRKSTWPG